MNGTTQERGGASVVTEYVRLPDTIEPGRYNAYGQKDPDGNLFLGIGSAEGPGTKTFSEQLTQAGIKNTYYESPGTAHEWLTWRRCFKEFAPRLFR